jgi:hypothetical protein
MLMPQQLIEYLYRKNSLDIDTNDHFGVAVSAQPLHTDLDDGNAGDNTNMDEVDYRNVDENQSDYNTAEEEIDDEEYRLIFDEPDFLFDYPDGTVSELLLYLVYLFLLTFIVSCRVSHTDLAFKI